VGNLIRTVIPSEVEKSQRQFNYEVWTERVGVASPNDDKRSF
jgi:hypothetical protein